MGLELRTVLRHPYEFQVPMNKEAVRTLLHSPLDMI